jgi:hypothetical protein
MLTWIINHSVLAGFNLINSRIDAHRILRHKNIAHGINLAAYLAVVGFMVYKEVDAEWHAGWPERWYVIIDAILFLFAALFNRQLSFDIPLNLRRKLAWDYQSVDNPPKAVMDKIERWLFGELEGKFIAGIYAVGFLLLTVKEAFYEWPIF